MKSHLYDASKTSLDGFQFNDVLLTVVTPLTRLYDVSVTSLHEVTPL